MFQVARTLRSWPTKRAVWVPTTSSFSITTLFSFSHNLVSPRAPQEFHNLPPVCRSAPAPRWALPRNQRRARASPAAGLSTIPLKKARKANRGCGTTSTSSSTTTTTSTSFSQVVRAVQVRFSHSEAYLMRFKRRKESLTALTLIHTVSYNLRFLGII